jgi:flagellar hook-associated protein 2
MTSIVNALGVGSGIDTKALIGELASNARQLRDAKITAKENANIAKISALATLKLGIEQVAFDFAESASAITVTSTPADLKKLVQNFIKDFNQLRSTLTDFTKGGSPTIAAGALSGDAAGRALGSTFGRLPQTPLAASGTYVTLSDIGISVSRYGTLELNSAKFDSAIAANPEEVKSVLTGASGLRLALRNLDDQTTGPDGPLTVASSRYERIATGIARERAHMDDETSRMVDRLTRSFSGMDRQVAKLNAVKSYIEQQIAAWNSSK